MANEVSNPQIGMQSDSLESAEANQTGGSEAFFDKLENEVNGSIQDTEATQGQFSGSEQATHVQEDTGSDNVERQSQDSIDYKKRYTDSSREAVKWRDRYKQVEQFVPVLEAMKNDSGLVEHVRDYLSNGGVPAKSMKEKLNLGEDFVFDQQEAMEDPESDSAKLMNAHVDGMVQEKVNSVLKAEKQRNSKLEQARAVQKAEQEFRERNKMSDEEFANFKNAAQNHKMTLDDIHYLLNRGKVAQNVAQNTKQDMLDQMKNVRTMPTSASGANSENVEKTPDREVFENILGFESKTDNLFG